MIAAAGLNGQLLNLGAPVSVAEVSVSELQRFQFQLQRDFSGLNSQGAAFAVKSTSYQEKIAAVLQIYDAFLLSNSRSKRRSEESIFGA